MPATTDLLNMARSVAGTSGSARRKIAGGVVLGGMFLAGLGKTLGRGMTDAAMDVAFGDPNADEKLLGTKLTPSLMLGGLYPGEASAGAVAGGTLGGGAIGTAAGAFLGRRFGKAGMIAGATIGGISGSLIGGTTASLATGGIGSVARGYNPTRFPVDTMPASLGIAQFTTSAGFLTGGIIGGIKGAKAGSRFGGGRKGAILGAVSGAALGGGVGAGTGAIFVGGSISQANQARKANSQIINESPFYNSSLLTAERLNARGDIVLGAHNTRRGGY